MPERTCFSYKLTAEQQATLREILRGGNFRPFPVQYAQIAVETPDFNVVLYTSGKCVVQGRGAPDFVTFTLEPLVLQSAQLGYEDVLNPQGIEPHMGVDESGKGDFFGPLVIAAAYVDATLAPTMRDMNVRDSKSITSDKVALAMGRDLRNLLGKRFSVVKIGPQAYNRLYSRMRNVNSILAWGHARAIENLLAAVPDCPRAISDQFGSKQQVIRALMSKGKRIDLVQRPKAESDLAVAAASVIAREIFLRSLKDLEVRYETPIPKGASDAVQDAAVAIGKKNSPGLLVELCKCHFKTTDVVLKKLGVDRTVLGPEGQARSKPLDRSRFHRKPAPTAQTSHPS